MLINGEENPHIQHPCFLFSFLNRILLLVIYLFYFILLKKTTNGNYGQLTLVPSPVIHPWWQLSAHPGHGSRGEKGHCIDLEYLLPFIQRNGARFNGGVLLGFIYITSIQVLIQLSVPISGKQLSRCLLELLLHMIVKPMQIFVNLV